jgi:hypothetical protein
MNQFHSTDLELNGKSIAPPLGKETYNQGYGIFPESPQPISPNDLEQKREWFV